MYLRGLILAVFIPLVCCNSKPLVSAMPLLVTDSTYIDKYLWLDKYTVDNKLVNRVPVPAGFTRLNAEPNSFSYWLRNIPLKPGHPLVYLFDGQLKDKQDAHYAVIDMEPGSKNLLQCADAVMRLRAEYLYATAQYDKIHFNFTSGFNCEYSKWKQGYRPSVNGNKVQWVKSAEPGNSYASFQKYLEQVFTYCGSKSLSDELKPVADIAIIQPGDVFVKGGFPGHAVIVMDVVENKTTGDKFFMLAQSYMPAQQPQLLKNPANSNLSPWYSVKIIGDLVTPQWTFAKSELMRWAD